ncbi:N-acetyltransferase domain-containing protein [Durusdinium trenchii]|uniref:N-acetyltransferase domain-containing protein n=1 Tax=Durusdinium trenchii TaxID=1381693 RepID=A0ABP0KUT5_9DINO
MLTLGSSPTVSIRTWPAHGVPRAPHAPRHRGSAVGSIAVGSIGAVGAVVTRRRRWGARASDRAPRRAVLLAELLGEIHWDELAVEDQLTVVVADLSDVERCMEIVVPVFEVKTEELESVRRGLAGRLGARRSLVGPDAAAPRPKLSRPAPHGSTEGPELGLVLALEHPEHGFVALVDLSLWPADGRVRAPGAKSKPGVASKPYVLNLCVTPSFRRQGLARQLMAVLERLLRDVWGDKEVYLHVEDKQVAANALYEAIGYVPMKYTYDKDFPYTKAEASILRNVTWRRKFLPVASEGSPARSGTILPEAKEEEEDEECGDGEEDIEDDGEEEDEEDEEEVPQKAEDEDFDWVTSLMK